VHALETAAIELARSLFDSFGWLGVVVAMAIESACIPFPSEVIMPLAGWLLVAEHGLGWAGVLQAGFWGAVGNLLGSALAYGVGAWGGRPLLERYGRWILVTQKDLQRADQWFARWGEATVFLARLVPVVRTFVSLPAGVARMPFGRFAAYTFAGSFLWSLALAAIGFQWGPSWEEFRERARFLDYPIAAAILAVIAWYVWHKARELRHEAEASARR
jgi:membrane protein DedA with SNARE-associated domain